MGENLHEFLNRQIRLRGWSIRETARAAAISDASVRRALDPKATKPAKLEVLLALAEAFNVEPYAVLHMAGLIPAEPRQAITERQLLHTFRQLPSEHQQMVVWMAEFMFTHSTSLWPPHPPQNGVENQPQTSPA